MKHFLIAASAVVVLLYLGKKASAGVSVPDTLPPVGSVGEKVKVGDIVVIPGTVPEAPGASSVLLRVESADATNLSGPIVGYRDEAGRSLASKPTAPITVRRSVVTEIAGNVPLPSEGPVTSAIAPIKDGDKVVVNGVTYPVLQTGDPLVVATGTPYTNPANQMKVPRAAVEKVIPR